MCAHVENPQEEKNQQKIEVILEKNQQTLLSHSYSLVNLVGLLLTVYVVILSATFSPLVSFSINSNNSNTSSPEPILPPLTTWYIFLVLSIGLIVIAVGILWRSITCGNKCFELKFTRECFPGFSVQLKKEDELRSRNIELLNKTIDQNKYIDHSIWCIVFSLIFFIAFILAKIGTAASYWAFIGFMFLIIFLLIVPTVVYNKQEKRIR